MKNKYCSKCKFESDDNFYVEGSKRIYCRECWQERLFTTRKKLPTFEKWLKHILKLKDYREEDILNCLNSRLKWDLLLEEQYKEFIDEWHYFQKRRNYSRGRNSQH